MVLKWIMGCVTYSSYVIFINGVELTFFKHTLKGLRQGCHLSVIIFVLVAKGLSWAIMEVKPLGLLKGSRLKILCTKIFFFLDDILFFNGLERENIKIHELLNLYCVNTCIEVNIQNSTICYGLNAKFEAPLKELFPYGHF